MRMWTKIDICASEVQAKLFLEAQGTYMPWEQSKHLLILSDALLVCSMQVRRGASLTDSTSIEVSLDVSIDLRQHWANTEYAEVFFKRSRAIMGLDDAAIISLDDQKARFKIGGDHLLSGKKFSTTQIPLISNIAVVSESERKATIGHENSLRSRRRATLPSFQLPVRNDPEARPTEGQKDKEEMPWEEYRFPFLVPENDDFFSFLYYMKRVRTQYEKIGRQPNFKVANGWAERECRIFKEREVDAALEVRRKLLAVKRRVAESIEYESTIGGLSNVSVSDASTVPWFRRKDGVKQLLVDDYQSAITKEFEFFARREELRDEATWEAFHQRFARAVDRSTSTLTAPTSPPELSNGITRTTRELETGQSINTEIENRVTNWLDRIQEPEEHSHVLNLVLQWKTEQLFRDATFVDDFELDSEAETVVEETDEQLSVDSDRPDINVATTGLRSSEAEKALIARAQRILSHFGAARPLDLATIDDALKVITGYRKYIKWIPHRVSHGIIDVEKIELQPSCYYEEVHEAHKDGELLEFESLANDDDTTTKKGSFKKPTRHEIPGSTSRQVSGRSSKQKTVSKKTPITSGSRRFIYVEHRRRPLAGSYKRRRDINLARHGGEYHSVLDQEQDFDRSWLYRKLYPKFADFPDAHSTHPEFIELYDQVHDLEHELQRGVGAQQEYWNQKGVYENPYDTNYKKPTLLTMNKGISGLIEDPFVGSNPPAASNLFASQYSSFIHQGHTDEHRRVIVDVEDPFVAEGLLAVSNLFASYYSGFVRQGYTDEHWRVIVDGSPIMVLGDGQNEDPVQSPSLFEYIYL
jgi:hypothetical protein